MQKDRLFETFPPVSTEEWKKKILKDLKGANYNNKLVWNTDEGFEVEPFYRSEDLDKFPHMNTFPGSFPYVRGNAVKNNEWLVRQDISVENIEEANNKAIKINHNGVNSIGFYLNDDFSPDHKRIEKLCKNIGLDSTEINFKSNYPLEIVEIFSSIVKKSDISPDIVSGCVEYDPISAFSLTGKFHNSEKEDLALLTKLHASSKHLPKFHYLFVDATIFNNSGGGIVSELAFAMAVGVEYLTYLTNSGFDIDEIAPRMRFHFSVGSNYFMEIAKFRAAKYLWSKIVKAYGVKNEDNAKMCIHCTNSRWNKTIYDPYVNMLRTTTESMSAILGGIHSLSVLPFDFIYKDESEFSERIARNQQIILKGESYFDKVADIGAGSYYIESLTNSLIHNAWERFLLVDKEGGYISSFKKGVIQKIITDEASKKDIDVSIRKKSLLGTNKFPNTGDSFNSNYEFANRAPKIDDEGYQPLVIYRGSEQLEKLRSNTDKYSINNERPIVWMFTYGDMAMRNAKSQFAGNFFGCAGFSIVDNQGFKTVEDGISAAKDANPDIVVICSSDNEYKEIAEPIYNALCDSSIVVLAGYPKDQIEKFKELGITNFIHVKSNLLEELTRYQDLLINNQNSRVE